MKQERCSYHTRGNLEWTSRLPLLRKRALESKMCGTRRVLALLALCVGLAHSFTWDYVLSGQTMLNFYNNGTLTRTERILLADITLVTYDPLHNRVLFADSFDGFGISSFDIMTKKVQSLVRCEDVDSLKFAYDPVTDTIFWIVHNRIYFLLKPGSNNAVDGNILFELDQWALGIAVDSCGGYIYWTTNNNIERARFDGSERKVVIDSNVDWRIDLAVDQQTQKIYWMDLSLNTYPFYNTTFESADLNGENRKTLYSEKSYLDGKTLTRKFQTRKTLTVSKEFIYTRGKGVNKIWKLTKNAPHQLSTHEDFCDYCDGIAAYYKLEDQANGSRTCESLTSLLPMNPRSYYTDEDLICVHGTKVPGEFVCECTQGYTGDRCDVSLCHNYCLHGDCRFSYHNKQLECRCHTGYSGQRCEVHVCHKLCLNNGVCCQNSKGELVCQCTADYKGERCEIPICQDYCFQGTCSVSAGQPHCRCDAGYSGKRCEVNECDGYCLNNGVCSMNEEGQPVCQCPGDYEGERCEVSLSVFFKKCYRVAPTLSSLRDILNTDVTPVSLDKEVLQAAAAVLLSANNSASLEQEP